MRWRRPGRSEVVVMSLAIGILFTSPSPALARKRKPPAPVVRACVDDYKSGLALEDGGQLIAARERFVRCSKAACGITLRLECTTRFTQLDNEIPSLVPIVTDAEGAPRFDVEVKMDGQLLTARLDGHAWQLDPGRHELAFSADGVVFSKQELLVVQGQRNRAVQATLTAPEKHAAAAPPAIVDKTDGSSWPVESAPGPAATLVANPASERSIPALTYVLSGTGVVGLAGFGLLTYWGRRDADLLAAHCSPSCAPSSADHIHRLYVGADVSLGVGAAALAGAYWAYAHARSGSRREESAAETAYVVGVAPTATGAVGTISGTF
jgi:hypothetical protein